LGGITNGLTFGVVAAALLLGLGASACTFDHLFNFFNCLACVRAFVRFALVCLIQNAAKYRKIKSPEYEGLGVQILNVMVH